MANYVEIKRIECTQAIAFDMLCAFDKFCKENGFVYSLAGGTLLGALRHKDMIPWDDDVDVFMLRENYNKFIDCFAGKTMLTPHYKVINIDTGFSGQTFARIIDLRTIAFSTQSVTFKNVWIDILPLDVVPDDYYERDLFQKEMLQLRKWRVFFNSQPMTGRTFFRKIVKTPIAAFGRKFGVRNQVCKKIIETAQRYKNTDANEVAEIVAQGWIKGTCCKETFKQSVEVELRGKMFSAMPDYNHYLTGQYGNYLELPPEKNHKAHKIDVKIDLDKYEGNLKEELMHYILKKDIEEKNLERLESMKNMEVDEIL